MKKILSILLSAMLLTTSVSANSFVGQNEIGQFSSSINITPKKKLIHVSGAEGMTMEVYNLTGINIASIQIESNDANLSLNLPKGCYIFKIGKVVRKISIS